VEKAGPKSTTQVIFGQLIVHPDFALPAESQLVLLNDFRILALAIQQDKRFAFEAVRTCSQHNGDVHLFMASGKNGDLKGAIIEN
jgi:hypothetical protein